MLQWKIGDVTVKRIVEMEVPVKSIIPNIRCSPMQRPMP